MKLTKRGEYALRTLIRLGTAQSLNQDVVSVATIAEGEKLPFKFLENILAELRQAGQGHRHPDHRAPAAAVAISKAP